MSEIKTDDRRQLAEVLPFVPRPTSEAIAQAAVIALLERYADLARAGEVTGVIIAAKTRDDGRPAKSWRNIAELTNANGRY